MASCTVLSAAAGSVCAQKAHVRERLGDGTRALSLEHRAHQDKVRGYCTHTHIHKYIQIQGWALGSSSHSFKFRLNWLQVVRLIPELEPQVQTSARDHRPISGRHCRRRARAHSARTRGHRDHCLLPPQIKGSKIFVAAKALALSIFY